MSTNSDCLNLAVKAPSKIVLAFIAALGALLGSSLGGGAEWIGRRLERPAAALTQSNLDENLVAHEELKKRLTVIENSIGINNAKLDLLIQDWPVRPARRKPVKKAPIDEY